MDDGVHFTIITTANVRLRILQNIFATYAENIPICCEYFPLTASVLKIKDTSRGSKLLERK